MMVAIGCTSTASPTRTDSARGLDAAEIDRRVEEAIETCMSRHGFDEYRPSPSLSLSDYEAGLDSFYFLAGADVFGYGSLVSAIAPPSGAMPQQVVEGESVAFYRALLGDRSELAAEDHDEISPEDEEDRGCLGEGELLREELTASLSLPTYDDSMAFRDYITKSEEYLAFSERWFDCMSERGFTPLASNPFDHRDEAVFSFVESSNFEAEMDAYPDWWEDALAGVTDIDEAWLADMSGRYPPFNAVLEAEKDMATADAACREENRSVIDPVMASFNQGR